MIRWTQTHPSVEDMTAALTAERSGRRIDDFVDTDDVEWTLQFRLDD